MRDSAALLDATAGPELGAPYWAPPQQRPFLKEVGADPGILRIALVLKTPSEVVLDPECNKSVTEAARLCENLGHKVEETVLPVDEAGLLSARRSIVRVSTARSLEDASKNSRSARNRTRCRALNLGDRASRTDNQQRRVFQSDYHLPSSRSRHPAKFHQTYDVTLSPTLAKPPVRLGVLSPTPEGVE